MIIDALRHWQPARGTVIELVPTAESLAAASTAEPHPVPASFLQENHVRGSAANIERGGSHKAYLVATSEVDGAFDADALVRAVRRFVGRHDSLRSWFSIDDGAVVRHMVDLSAIEFGVEEVGRTDDYGYLRRASTETTPGLVIEFSEYVDARLSAHANALSWPGFVVGAVARDGGFTLYYGCDHSISDGVSQALVIAELADFYYSERDGTEVGPFTSAPTGSILDYVVAERAAAATFSAESPEVQGWLEIFGRHDNRMPHFQLDLGLEPGETSPMYGVRYDVLDGHRVADFERICADNDARMIAGIVAALAITDYELAGTEEYFGITALSDRGTDYLLSQGWFCSFAPVSFPVRGATTFTELLAAAHEGCRRGKELSVAPVHIVLGTLMASGLPNTDAIATPQLLSYIDFRRFPQAGTPVYDRCMQTTGEGRTANASMWFQRDADTFYFGAQTPNNEIAQANLARYHAHLCGVFTAVVTDGDYTISSPAEKEQPLARHND